MCIVIFPCTRSWRFDTLFAQKQPYLKSYMWWENIDCDGIVHRNTEIPTTIDWKDARCSSYHGIHCWLPKRTLVSSNKLGDYCEHNSCNSIPCYLVQCQLVKSSMGLFRKRNTAEDQRFWVLLIFLWPSIQPCRGEHTIYSVFCIMCFIMIV